MHIFEFFFGFFLNKISPKTHQKPHFHLRASAPQEYFPIRDPRTLLEGSSQWLLSNVEQNGQSGPRAFSKSLIRTPSMQKIIRTCSPPHFLFCLF